MVSTVLGFGDLGPTYSSSTRYGDESNEAWRATLTAGLGFASTLGSRAPRAAYQHQEVRDGEALILAQWGCEMDIGTGDSPREAVLPRLLNLSDRGS